MLESFFHRLIPNLGPNLEIQNTSVLRNYSSHSLSLFDSGKKAVSFSGKRGVRRVFNFDGLKILI